MQPSGDSNDWRESVLQTYRNGQVREIASELASLEPGASQSSKLMLAMRFEDTIFKQASSLADYRKRIVKRLTKLKKSYVPPTEQGSSTVASDRTEELMKTLRTQYGEAVKYIVQNADAAIQDVAKSGADRSNQLRQHTDSALEWAKQLGVWDGGPLTVAEAAAKFSEADLQKLQQHLERRVDNIRMYVVKHADPDLFLFETVEKKDQELKERANEFLSICVVKYLGQLKEQHNASVSGSDGVSEPTTGNQEKASQEGKAQAGKRFDAHKALQEALEKAQATVPAPTRRSSTISNSSNNDVPAAMVLLEKMRAASTALLAYLGVRDRQLTAPRKSLEKIMNIIKEGETFVTQVSDQSPHRSADHVILSDAWTKHLELPSDAPSLVTGDPTDEGSSPKRQKLDPSESTTSRRARPYTTARVLLSPNRKTPSNLIPALRRKRARLVRPPHGSRGSHLILEFETVFTMTIYFSPLLVTLRAMAPPKDSDKSPSVTNGNDRPMSTTTQLSTKGCVPWTPLYHGLTDRQDLSVWGVKDASYESVGRVVEERLRDASMHATHILRRCFGHHVKDKTAEFEVEILEASALLEFLQIARTTYMPNWEDDEDQQN